MTIETEVAALTVATTALLSTVNVKKDTLDGYITATSASAALAGTKATDATTQAELATASATAASNSAGNAASSATTAVAAAQTASEIVGFVPASKANVESPTFTGNVGGISKAMVGLGNVDNTADANKPVSTAQAAADGLKQSLTGKDASDGYAGLTLFKLNLRNAANTVTSFFTSAATAARTWTLPDRSGTLADNTDLALKANLASPTFTGTVGGITSGMVGLDNANNTSDLNKPVSTAQQTALDNKLNKGYMQCRDERSAGTAGGGSSVGEQTRVLNTTVSNTITGALLNGGAYTITLLAGTYRFSAHAPAFCADKHQLRLDNHTDTTVIARGTNEFNTVAAAVQTRSFVSGRFTLATTKEIKLTHYFQTALVTTGLGPATNISATENYATIEIWQE